MTHKIDKQVLSFQYASNLKKNKFKEDNASRGNLSSF